MIAPLFLALAAQITLGGDGLEVGAGGGGGGGDPACELTGGVDCTMSGPFWAADGTASAPSYSFGTADTQNTGWYRIGTDTIGFSVNGTLLETVGPSTGDRINVAGGTLASTFNVLDVSATMSSTSAVQIGARLDITSAGSDANAHTAQLIALGAGYTGAGGSFGLQATNVALGGGNAPVASVTGNFGASAVSSGASSGASIGLYARGVNASSLNAGVIGIGSARSGTIGIGVVGVGNDSPSDGTNIGGFFCARCTDGALNPGRNVALAADVPDGGSDVAVFRASSVDALLIASDGTSRFSAGSVGSPTISWAGEVAGFAMGFYKIGTADMGFSVAGILRQEWTATTTSFLPSATGGGVNGVFVSAVGTGTAAGTAAAQRITFAAGYTGSGATAGLIATNANAGTGATGFTTGAYNAGVSGVASGTTTGDNFGVAGTAANGNRSYGVRGLSSTDKASGVNAGVVGVGKNGGASGVAIGGYFAAYSTVTDFTPAVSAGLVASNGDTTLPIAVFADNMTTSITIDDGGGLQYVQAVTSLATTACDAAAEVGRVRLYSRAASSTISMCACVQTAAATFAWEGMHASANCAP